jgi:hypothetical protein
MDVNHVYVVTTFPTKKHFFTLPPTLEEAQIAVKEY